ncbi:branched-chain amino acid ABC transporter permease [Bradyrhizobium sp. JYMT SZCCT0428]|uniref:branched-chain amino acid ABC transporter permease n=1 Tax=Bradyrhizobium sp. JYMT SZCCT0428 TaxID=2807673 RepID=UPI001BA489A8|nr:branched-chain amino acid ABC transporter permease [Bradyrhizobium sp. JYMT SZCCT0428]MBR1154066.1 branched-chain amino acid ABC transporter permease [Bradyrhizobium sp. JYMT SZCCT0428]
MTERNIALCLAAILAVLPFGVTNQYVLFTLTSAGILVIAAMSLNLLLGYAGQLSLGHVAFFGIGAYVSALFSLGFEFHYGAEEPIVVPALPVWIAFVLGICFAGVFGWIIGKLAFRVRGAFFVILTIGFAQVSRMVALNWVSLTNGPMALTNIPPLSFWLPGHGIVPIQGRMESYYVVLILGIIAYWILDRIVHSRVGRALVALRENEPLARSVGIRVTRYLVLATAISAAMAGGAGAMYAHYVRVIDPDVFMFIYTVTMVIMVMTGGKGTLLGPVVGGLIFGLLPELLRQLVRPELQLIIYGVAMILIVFFLPRGIVPALLKRPSSASNESKSARMNSEANT